ncbi:MAG: adenylate/guanylate cyclase domain-containing protein [Chloroflexota bacterium]
MADKQSPTFNQIMQRLSQDVLQIRSELQSSKRPPSNFLLDKLTFLAKNINRLSKQLAKIEQEQQRLEALRNIGQVVNSSLELNEVLRIVMDTIVRLTRAERGFLMLRNEEGELEIRIARNWEQETVMPSDFAISRTVCNRVISTAQPILTTDAQEDTQFQTRESIIALNLRSILCVPLQVKGKLTGLIYTDNRMEAGAFTESERDLLTSFANQAAVALENARLYESIRRTLAEVTELKNLMDNIFASIASGVITSDITDRITLCNRAASTILSQSTDDLIGHTIDEKIPHLAPHLKSPMYSVRKTEVPIMGLEISSDIPTRGHLDLRCNLSPLKDAQQITQGVVIVLDDMTEMKRLESLHRLFERMVSPAVINQLDPEKTQLGGKRTNITCLFADVRGFTSFSEYLSPEQVVSVLNRYLAAAANAVLEQEGTIDKFIGDAIMAWFNAPIPQHDHTLRAIRAALGIRKSLIQLHKTLPSEFHLSFGVGIHYGEAVLGAIGTKKRIDYTAIGDSINTAKRIQENALPGQILISYQAWEFVKDQVEVKTVEPISAKGKSEPLTVFEVLRVK